jgi:L,D-peptidoglycan transpeptidase YkuD (ErfK/YbiS/YcfS/YnhG family)
LASFRKVSREAFQLALGGLLLFSAGCTKSEPFEARLAELQERQLWRAEAETYAPDEYRQYRTVLRRSKDTLIQLEGKFVWFRNYDAVAGDYRNLLAQGEQILKAVAVRRADKKSGFAKRLAEQREKIERLDTLTSLISVGKSSREFLAKAEILTNEAETLAAKTRYADAEDRLKRAATYMQISREVITPALRRFVDQDQITTWRSRVAETIRESKIRGGYAIVVSKVDRKLVLYKSGRQVRSYDVGLGSGSIRDKVCSGDRATPEGKYRVIRKLPQSKYFKALLINYPNEDDQRQFATAKRRGQIPRRAGIGGLIEIHGGGKEGMTYGCVALDDRQMEELYAIADVGTPVTIVGATDYENCVTVALRGL